MKFIVKENTILIDFLLKATGTASKTKIRDWLGHKCVAVDGVVQKRGDISLAAGQTVTVEINRHQPKGQSVVKQGSAPFPLLFEDRYLIAMEKPAGLLSIGTDREKTKTFFKAVSNYVEVESDGKDKIFIIHRLDREVSGVMIFAKGEQIKEDVQQSWTDTEKIYLALVEGQPATPEGTIENWIRESGAFTSHSCAEDAPGAQFAVTHYKVLKTFAHNSLLEIRIDTGRKHQIRVHLSEMGCPIVGDKKYGADGSPIKRLGLHAFSLSFTHPVTSQRIRLESPPPAIFQHFGKHNRPDTGNK
ncbi:MAG: RluA family pseudouridine synthase [Bacteroidota bacterium]